VAGFINAQNDIIIPSIHYGDVNLFLSKLQVKNKQTNKQILNNVRRD
jgi:hypothetical protein